MNTELDDLIGVDYGEEYYPSRQMTVIKKDGTADPFNVQKVLNAVSKSAFRASVTFTEVERRKICENIISRVDALPGTEISIAMMHNIVEQTLDLINPVVAKSYRDYRNYKQDFVKMLDEVYKKSQSIMYIGDKENSNTDSALVSTKRSLVFNQLNKELYKKFFLTTEELQACNDGYIYIHDMSARRDTMNCFRRDTRFITKDGIKSFYDFSDGDITYVLSHKGIWQKAIVHKYGHQNLQKVTFKMGTYTSKEWIVYCTPNHRWILKDGTETTDLKVGDILWQVPDITIFNWESLTLEEKKLWCRGFVLGDGSIIGNRSKTDGAPDYAVLRLCGEKTKYAYRFKECGYNITHVSNNANDLLVHILDCTDKEIPWLSLNYNNIIYYINGLMCADGHKKLGKSPASEFRGIQITGDLNKYIYNLLNIAGYFVGTTKDLTGQITNYGPRTEETILYNIHSSQNRTSAWRVKSIEPTTLNPKAEVWCLDVENDHSFLLEGGIPTGNCCLFDVGNVLKGGFEMGNVWYNEPKTLDTAFDVIGDIVLSGASQQYGGFTVPEVDKILAPYAEKSYTKYYNEYLAILQENGITENVKAGADAYAMKKVKRDFMQGVQGWEYKFNTVSSSRGDYPFITMTFGIGTSRFEKMASIAMLDVRREGQGKKDRKKPVLFPKLVFLYDENLHGPGKPLEDVFEAGIKCSAKTMYPDWLSLTGNGYVPSMYKQYGRVVSPMGCRAFLSPWYERGGTHPADKADKPIFVGRFNIGVVSLHLPMILAKARQENKDFYDVLDYYLELIRKLHIRTYAYLGEMRASTNPLAYCEGGFLGGHLNPSDKIKPLLKPMTASFGITALNELQELYNGKSLVEDGTFAVEVMEYINAKVNQFKEEDDILYALYGTPAENLCQSGETLIQTYNGEIQIKDIQPGDLVYSFNEKLHKIELKPVIAARKTQDHAVVVKITLDNGQTVTCTPNHPFCIRTVENSKVTGKIIGQSLKWIEAKDLKPGMSLKSNYIKINSLGRPQCSNYYNGKQQLIQTINAEYAYGEIPKGYVVHHRDEDKLNNDFDNLQVMTNADHRRAHIKNISEFNYTSETQRGERNSFYGKHHTVSAILANRNAHIGKSIERFDMNGKWIDHYDCIEDAERAGFTRHLVKLACNNERTSKIYPSNYYKNSLWYFTDECTYAMEANHKVVSVEYLQDLIPVYNIEVADNHNYFVGGNEGILVHNCGLQVKQFREKYGVVPNVSDRPYVSNSFHCHVSEDITPIEKQDLEHRFWNTMNGGKIQYVKYPVNYNIEAIKTLVRRAMQMGYYEGVNLSLAYCDDCGHQELEMDVCPVCGSRNLTKIERMNGYLSYSRVHGDTRLNDAKMAEIADRKSM